MTGLELATLRKGLPKTTPASELARRLGYTRQWVSYQEGRADDVAPDLRDAYLGAIETLRLEQKGHDAEIVDVDWHEILNEKAPREPVTYAEGLAAAREWMRAHPKLRSIAITSLDTANDPADVLTLVGVIDALDRAGVDVSFRSDYAGGPRVIRSK